jgi:peroxiredoxin
MANESLQTQFDALHAERERTWPAAQLKKNVDQRQHLVDVYDAHNHIQPGDKAPAFTLLNVDGGTLTRDDLIKDGPAVLIFFRFAGCPACNIALPYYERHLWPELKAAGIKLVAISPQVPDRLIDIKTRHNLGFSVASDPDNRLGNALGITFAPEDQPTVKPGDSWIGELTGTNSWVLPQPTVLFIDRDATVRFVDVSPDWLNRTDPATILAQVPHLTAVA